MTNVAVIGCGKWGINYVRIFEEIPDARVEWIFDRDESSMRRATQRFPTVKAAKTITEVLGAADVTAVIVATPAAGHYEAVRMCLEAGKHVLVEKPITLSIDETQRLISLAESAGKILMVGHTFIYNPGVRKLKECVKSESFGRMYYLHATRTNMGPIRHDVNALWDLATHDVAIFNYVLERSPEWVSVTGVRLFDNEREDVGFMTLGYPDGVIGNIHVSWADPYKVREVVAVGSRRRVVFNDLESVERVKVFDKGVLREEADGSYGEFRLHMREGDIISPRVENREPLKEQCQHFLECVESGSRPVSDGAAGLDVIRVMLAADRSLARQGAPVEVASMPAAAAVR